MAGSVKLYPRTETQSRAADPSRNIWVEASAGTGKTQVLTDRILRLLLAGVLPERILALTFTRAAAAEMQNRLTRTLARWRQADDEHLRAELQVLEADNGEETLARARRLFAEVLDLPAGLALQTLHGFAQSLLAGFPLEAGLSPGFVALDERDAHQLKTQALSEAIAEAQEKYQQWFLEDLGELALIGGQDGLDKLIEKLLQASEAFAAYGSVDAIAPMVRRMLDVPEGAKPGDALCDGLARGNFDDGLLEEFAALLESWGTDAKLRDARVLQQWLALSDEERFSQHDLLHNAFFTKSGEPRSMGPLHKKFPQSEALTAEIVESLESLQAREAAIVSAELNIRALRVGHLLSDRYRALKRAEGVVDYDDMINVTVRLLGTPGVPDWIKYKLDQRFDHILVDEAQDTNRQQWAVIGHLVDDYFTDEDRKRTLFVVGDFKQAIYRFQGTDPKVFAAEGRRLGELASRAGRNIDHVPLDRSFRSGPAILDLVNSFLEDAGPDALGLSSVPEPHIPNRANAGGEVVIWPLVTGGADDEEEQESDEQGDSDSEAARAALAGAIAREIKDWLSAGEKRLWLPAHKRFVRPEDILILLQQRSSLMLRIVEELHRLGIPVAGVDRLTLTEPLAALDLIALLRFATQPDDDLNLANLLVSPFLGWDDHEQIRLLSQDRDRRSLWRRLGEAESSAAKSARQFLSEVLKLADRSTPYEFLDQILSGPIGGRRLLTARLGSEAGQVIDEMLNQALSFEERHPPLLAEFVYWLTADKFEVRREPDPARGEVRLMTIHGSKGLEAPVVILGDTGLKHGNRKDNTVQVEVPETGSFPFMHDGKKSVVPILCEALDENNAADEQERLRLLYVALTRAADHLYIGGSISLADAENLKPEECNRWHSRLCRVMENLDGAEKIPAEHFGGDAWRIRRGDWPERGDDGAILRPDSAVQKDLGGLKLDQAPDVGPLGRPLRPSKMPEGPVEGPALGERKSLAERGLLMHKLFEKLPDVRAAQDDETKVRAIALNWLAGRDVAGAEAEEMVSEVLSVMAAHPELFVPGGLAEAPIMGIVDGHVVTGVVDRLIVRDDKVLVIDFKTGTFVPNSVAQMPPGHQQQMALYTAVLEGVFPGKSVEAALLYTAGPKLILLGGKQLHLVRKVDPVEVTPN